MGMKFGYARTSTDDQVMDLQIDALKAVGVDERFIYSEHISGMKDDRPEWLKLKEMLRPGDTLYIWKLDRLGRSSKMLIETAQYLKDHDIQLISITDNIDTSTPMGQFFYGMMALLAEVERNITSERTKAGLAAARARGRYGGRPKLDETVLEMAYMMYESRKYPVKQILEKFNISKTALYNYIDVVKKKEAEAAVKGIAK